MKSSGLMRLALILALITVNIGCDQFSKSIVREKVDFHENIELIDDYFILTKVENTGALLSLGSTLSPGAKKVVLLLLPTLMLFSLLIFVLVRAELEQQIVIGLCFIVGGGIGNIFDRYLYGSVTDFLHIDLGLLRTGVFNMADVSVMIGTALVIAHGLKKN
ncbi:signal peptidase II [Flavilitoribacter nigricans]|uniref:Lipoprotein signal peptidase n=1 Tax=Flavilitoribacter nigricans (strain ATCC 23147 / DSM 23189 / NBRC 102662 / NCIMB 1420 / SS-2) TaxID=1122177 RepID=A0A2D0MXW1_FLAN2|nr:signal peptidase II [Flavilitoribacter nigricans]PHN00966.1 signal peptidase II [Flavilitoribacter nigricans DSM 23189 = NBRC 102662]